MAHGQGQELYGTAIDIEPLEPKHGSESDCRIHRLQIFVSVSV
jgi:hypothetical protein